MSGSYEVVIGGRLSPALASEFEQLALSATPRPAQTVLSGWLEDQSALQGVLRRIEALGLELVEVRQVGHTDDGWRRDDGSR